MAFRKLFFKRVTGIRDNYVLQEGDIALDEDDFQLYRGDGSTIGGIAITSTGGTSADTVSTGNGTDVTVTGGESTASGSTGGRLRTPVIACLAVLKAFHALCMT